MASFLERVKEALNRLIRALERVKEALNRLIRAKENPSPLMPGILKKESLEILDPLEAGNAQRRFVPDASVKIDETKNTRTVLPSIVKGVATGREQLENVTPYRLQENDMKDLGLAPPPSTRGGSKKEQKAFVAAAVASANAAWKDLPRKEGTKDETKRPSVTPKRSVP